MINPNGDSPIKKDYQINNKQGRLYQEDKILPIPQPLESRPKQVELPSQFTFNLLATPWKTGPFQAGPLKQDIKKSVKYGAKFKERRQLPRSVGALSLLRSWLVQFRVLAHQRILAQHWATTPSSCISSQFSPLLKHIKNSQIDSSSQDEVT